VRAGGPAVCAGTVAHRRRRPTVHEFTAPLSQVWIDPDDPDALCDLHPMWSARRPAPARFRRSDYGDTTTGSLADGVRTALAPVIGRSPAGEVRMLTQVRRWGWLFNPITVYVAWDTDPDAPVGAVLEVTNTPWKQRHRYPIALTPPNADGWMSAVTDKELHVSPFLDESFRYDVRLRDAADRIELDLDVVPHGGDQPTLVTAMTVDRRPASRASLGAALRANPFPTHRVSLGIHAQALRLWRKRVPFVAHPAKREARA
jgi:uncharacterized protein